MLKKGNVLFNVADHPTPKIDKGGVAYTLESRDYKCPQVAVLENHPQDSRVKIKEDGIVQTLNGKMGTGGGNTPMVMETVEKGGNNAGTQNEVLRLLEDGKGGDGMMDVSETVVRRLTPL